MGSCLGGFRREPDTLHKHNDCCPLGTRHLALFTFLLLFLHSTRLLLSTCFVDSFLLFHFSPPFSLLAPVVVYTPGSHLFSQTKSLLACTFLISSSSSSHFHDGLDSYVCREAYIGYVGAPCKFSSSSFLWSFFQLLCFFAYLLICMLGVA